MLFPARIFALVILIMLGSCGFQPRGSMPVADLEQVYVLDQVDIRQMIDRPLSERLANDLSARVGHVLSVPKTNVPGIIISSEQVNERSLGLSANLLNRQIELEKRVDYEIVGQSGETLFSGTLVTSEILTESQSSLGSMQQQRRILLNSMNADLSRRLIFKLDSLLKDNTGQ